MNAEQKKNELLLGLQEETVDARRRLAELRADAYRLAVRFASDGVGTVGQELGAALKEVMQACEVVHRRLLAIRRRMQEVRGRGAGSVSDPEVMWFRDQRADWLASMRAKLLETAADVHREAENARRSHNARVARRFFMAKNRFEAVAAAIGEFSAHESDDTDGPFFV